MILKKLYKNSAREQGTLRYFREKLQRRNVTNDVKHYEDCEQLFLSIGKCFTMEALLEFFRMESKEDRIKRNRPPYYILEVDDNKKKYYDSVLDKFVDQFLINSPNDNDDDNDEESSPTNNDFVTNYSLCLLKHYFIFLDFKDAVKEGNGETIAILHKQLVPHFKALPGFNNYAIEMLISVVQNSVF